MRPLFERLTRTLVSKDHPQRPLLALFLLALILRVALALLWLPDMGRFQSGDYNLYYLGADAFAKVHS